MLKTFKKKLAQEEEAFERLKREYPHLANMNETAILSYLGIASHSKVVKYVEGLDTKVIPEMQIEDVHCSCTDADGNTKYLYRYKKDAEKARTASQREQNITLKIYACPTSRGWHLTKE